MQVNGTIVNIRKEAKGAKGHQVSYLTVEGFSEEINAGFDFKNKYVAGNPFSSDVVQNKYNDWVPSDSYSLRNNNQPSGGGNAAPVAAAAPAPVAQFKGKPYPLPADHGDNSIVNQNSMAHAVALVNGMLGEATGLVDEDISKELNFRVELALKAATSIADFSTGRSGLAKVGSMFAVEEVS